ncbi:ribosomal RNA small subunit methyltransferase A [Candidatus Kaiserbacteria bacterium]|nr:ribosomal RNA small subunit methyltransferase A [Candidatus Kaiserbacteria bacterium]
MEERGRIQAKKSLGQHFLNNPRVPGRMADAVSVTAGDVVVEIGPGTGVLTRTLLDRGATVIAIEADARAISILEEAFPVECKNKQLTLIHGDITDYNITTLPIADHHYKVVANIPYYLSGLLFRKFLETTVQPSDLVFLVQKEVAERIVHDPKESLLSLSVKVYGAPRYVEKVGKGNFSPAPKVDSAIIAISHISRDAFASRNLSEEVFFDLLHVGFAARRKQLLGNLAARFDRAVLIQIFSTLDLPTDIRGEDVSPEAWLDLVRLLTTPN